VYSKPSAPRSIGGVLEDGYRLGRAGFSRTWPLALAAQILVALPFLILKLQFGYFDIGDIESNMMLLQSPKYSLLYFALAVLSAAFQNAITAQNAAVAQGVARSMAESMSIGVRLLPRTMLLALLLVAGFLLIAICFMMAGFFAGQTGRLLLALLFLIPVFFYLGRVFLANVIFVVEDIGAYASLLRSWHLTQDHYWRTSTILSVLLIVLIAVLALITGLTGVVATVLGARNTMTLALVELISAAANMVFTPFISAVLLAIYYDLGLRKEGKGLVDLQGRRR
jgi:hypothetical protein